MYQRCRIRAACELLFLTAPILVAMPLHADAVTVQPRVSIGVQNYRIGVEDIVTANPNVAGNFNFRDGFSVSDSLDFVGAGLTVTRGRWFADLSGQWSGKGRARTEQFLGSQIGPNQFASSAGRTHTIDAEFDRQEENLTIGYGVTSNFSAYIGYKRSQVNLDNKTQPVLSPAPIVGDVLFLGVRRIDFSYNGGFIGATYAFPVGPAGGSLALQSSIARLNGDFGFRFDGNVFLVGQGFQLVPIDPSFFRGNTPGTSLGLNIGVAWTQGLGGLSSHLEKLSYTLGIDRSQYDFDADEPDTANFKERNTRVRLDLRYRFDWE